MILNPPYKRSSSYSVHCASLSLSSSFCRSVLCFEHMCRAPSKNMEISQNQEIRRTFKIINFYGNEFTGNPVYRQPKFDLHKAFQAS